VPFSSSSTLNLEQTHEKKTKRKRNCRSVWLLSSFQVFLFEIILLFAMDIHTLIRKQTQNNVFTIVIPHIPDVNFKFISSYLFVFLKSFCLIGKNQNF